MCRDLNNNCLLVCDFSDYSEPTFLNELSQIDSNNADVSKSFSAFHNKINKLLDKHAPLKPLSKHSLKNPVIKKGSRRLIKIKNTVPWGHHCQQTLSKQNVNTDENWKKDLLISQIL